MVRDVEHFFMSFLAIVQLLPLKKLCLVNLPIDFGNFVFELSVYSGYQSLVRYTADKGFSHSVGSLFSLEAISFDVQKLFK
jgi:hypothetical protein